MPDNVPFFVPFKQNPHFVGRTDDMHRLHAALQGDQTVGIIPAGITGLGGVGKTQLAVRYVYDYADHYPDGVYWLTATQELDKVFAEFGQQLWQILPYRHLELNTGSLGVLARMVHSLFDEGELNTLCFELQFDYEDIPGGGLARAQKLVSYLQRRERLADLTVYIQQQRSKLVNQPQDELIRLAFTYLRENPHSLLVLDNLSDPATLHEPVSRDWIPAQLPGHILFTTRRRDVDGCHSIELMVLPEPVALALLLRHPRRRPALEPEHLDHETARQICALLGYLPLALEVAGAHLGRYDRAPMSQYLAELRQRGAIGVLDDTRMSVTPAVHGAGVVAVLDSQYENLTSLEAQRLLQVAGLSAEATLIPVARLGLLAGIPEEASFFEVTLAQALGYLQDASLIEELKEGQIRLHPLVREYTARLIVTPYGRKALAQACAGMLAKAYEHFPTLERHCAQRGVTAVQEDLRVALDLIDPEVELNSESLPIPPWRKVLLSPFKAVEQPLHDVTQRLQMLLRLLQRERHNLHDWQPHIQPFYFKQQIVYRAFDLGMRVIEQQIEHELKAMSTFLVPIWSHKQESSTLERTLSGHAGEVWAVAVTPDGRRIISASSDGTVKMWDMQTGQEERILRGHASRVWAVTVTPDGRRVISASDDQTVKVWDVQTGQEERTLRGHSGSVSAVVVTPDGRRVISASDDQTVKVWDVQTGQEERTLRGHSGSVNAVAVAPDGRRVISASDDQTVKVWDVQTGQEERTLRGHSGSVSAVVVTPDGRRIISASIDQTIKVWDVQTEQEERTFRGHSYGVMAVAVTPDGRRVISASNDQTVKVWDVQTGQEERTLRGHSNGVMAVAVTPDGRRIISASADQTVKVWGVQSGEDEHTLRGHSGWVRAVAVTPDGRCVVSASLDQTMKLWDVQTGQEERTLRGHSDWVSAVVVTPDGRRIISASVDQTVKVWDVQTGQEERTLRGHSDAVVAIAVTPDGRHIISVSVDQIVKVWDVQTGQEERTLRGHSGWVRAVAVTPDGRHAISASEDRTLKVWDVQTEHVEHTLSGHLAAVTAVAVTSDGRHAISASEDRTLKVWDLQTGHEERTLSGHTGEVWAVTVTPDGRRAISASEDRTVKVWDVVTGAALASLTLDGSLYGVVVAMDGVTIFTGDGAGSVYCLRFVDGVEP